MILPTAERSVTCIKSDFNPKEEQCIAIKVNEFYEVRFNLLTVDIKYTLIWSWPMLLQGSKRFSKYK